MISERLRDTYVMWSDPNSPYCDGTPHGAEVVLDAADVIDALVAALERAANEGQKGKLSLHALMACGDALAMARRK